MPSVPKAICMFTIFGYYFLLLGISCTLYITILRKRGKFGHNNVHILDQKQIKEIEISSVNSNTNPNEERTFHTIQSQEIHFSLPIEEDGLERKRQLAEIQSAMRSLETNFVFTSILILTYVIANFFSKFNSLFSTFLKILLYISQVGKKKLFLFLFNLMCFLSKMFFLILNR
jgi:hypothetical protein